MKCVTGWLLMFIAMSIPAFGQPTARLTTIHAVQGDEQARLTLYLACDGMVQYTLNPENLYITDNDRVVEDFHIVEHPSAVNRSQFSVALVLDASGSMSGAGNRGAIEAARDFIGYMDSTADEAALLWFNQMVQLQQTMTSSKALLDAAALALPAGGATALWDAAYYGVELVASQGHNPKRAVLVLTDGNDNASVKSPLDIIALAQLHDVRVFTVGLGYSIAAAELEQIALLTGGQYFQTPNAAQLQTIFNSVVSFVGRGYDEHVVAFRSPDPGAAMHRVVVHVALCQQEVESGIVEASLQTSSVDGERVFLSSSAPTSLALGVNVPNPFSPGSATTIPFEIRGSVPRHVRLQVFDMLGRRVATLVDRELSAGAHSVTFAPEGLSRGAYLYRLSDGDHTVSKTMLLR
jgi:Mg-chelatase subunit ChlD